MSSIALPTPVNLGTTPAPGPASNSEAQLTSEDTFLKLLVAQIQNQDPTSPTDPTQFVGQLTQYSELEQLMQINSGISTIDGGSSTSSSGSTSSGSTGAGSGASDPTPATPSKGIHTDEQEIRTNLPTKL
jgi:flagellar basal-body rod modification protein FlgD